MNLIERYVAEIGKHLPSKSRADIEAELRSTLEDMLEDRSQQAGRPADEAMVEELLTQYGAPREVAKSYLPTRYLIGPRLYPMFILVLKIVIFAVVLGLTIATVVSLAQTDMTQQEVWKALGEYGLSLISGIIQAFGNLVIVFAILERVLPAAELEDANKWTPAELTEEPDPAKAKSAEMVASIVFTIIALLVFNVYPQILGMWTLENGTWTQIAGLSDAFFRYLPLINLSCLLTIALNVFLLRSGLWNTTSRLLHIGIQLIGIGIAAALLNGPALLQFSSSAIKPDVVNTLISVFDRMIPFILLIVIVVNSVEIIKTVAKIVRQQKVALPFEK